MTTRSRTHLSQSVGNRIPFGKQNSRVRRFVRLQNGRSDALDGSSNVRLSDLRYGRLSVRPPIGNRRSRSEQTIDTVDIDRNRRKLSETAFSLDNRFSLDT
ncbi:unnamed protein product [Microthlaspi erraticum]|uniref:Uncharacterized protein n=1 Tax=Microthlaspi erraticum TaxID=1685480 RepID=A0A6D2JH16_9BRAS|nr:unnamed protein product [Microthlaspi erraticum]